MLCTCLPAHGHFHPMAPLARALVAAGHEVAVATAEEFCPYLERPVSPPSRLASAWRCS